MEHEEAGPAVDVLTNYSASFTLSDPNNCHNIPDIWQYFLYDLNAFKCQFYADFSFFFISSDCNLFCFNKIDNTLSLYICNSSVFAFTRCADMFSRYHNHLISEGRCVDHRNRCPCGSEDSHNDSGSTGAGPSPGLRLHWWDGTLQPWKNPREGGPCQRSRSFNFSILATPLMLMWYGRYHVYCSLILFIYLYCTSK